MKKRQSAKKTQSIKKIQDIDRIFIGIPEVAPDQWRENLDVFFDENETGLDHVRHLMDISRADIDRYHFTGGYEFNHLLQQKPDASLRPKKTRALITRLGDFAMVYQGTGCFRYALP